MKEVSSLKNKVVIILGSTGLIGKNIVDSFLQSGAKVIGVDINNSLLKKQEKLKKVFYSEFVTRINSGIGKNHVRKSFINFIKKVKQKKIKKIWPKQYNLNVK